MNLKEFSLLSEEDQYNIVVSKGVKIAERKSGVYQFCLYQIDSFYIESKLHTRHMDIHSISSFISTSAPLEPYLNQIDITELL